MQNKFTLNTFTSLGIFLLCLLMVFNNNALQAQCMPNIMTSIDRGDDGEGIAYNPNDGLLYHTTGNSGDPFETMDLSGNTITTLGTLPAEMMGFCWYPPLNVFLVYDDDELYHATTAGVFTFVGTSGDDLKGLAVVGTQVFGVTPFDSFLHEIDPVTGASLNVIPLGGAAAGLEAQGLSTHPDGTVYIVYEDGAGAGRNLGTIDVTTGVVTDIGDMGEYISAIVFLPSGDLYAITGENGSATEELWSDFPASCAPAFMPPAAVPTLGQWGMILFTLLLLTLTTVAILQRQLKMAGASTSNSAFPVNFKQLPFDKALFNRWFVGVLLGAIAVFGLAITLFGYQLTSADLPGTLLTAPLLAYLLHLGGINKGLMSFFVCGILSLSLLATQGNAVSDIVTIDKDFAITFDKAPTVADHTFDISHLDFKGQDAATVMRNAGSGPFSFSVSGQQATMHIKPEKLHKWTEDVERLNKRMGRVVNRINAQLK